MNTRRSHSRGPILVCQILAGAAFLLLLGGCGTAGASGGGGGTTGSAAVSTNPTTLLFGNVAVGTTSSKTVVVTNTGNADLVVSAVTVAGAGFAVSPISLPLTITAGSSYTATITFSPQTAGATTGTANITSNASGSPTSVSFTGTGVTTATPAISLVPASLAFGNVTVGSSSTKTVAISNTGNADLIISGIPITGSGFSMVSTTFPLTVTAGSTYSASFGFNPTATGSSSGTATISSNAGGSSPVISLSGTGVSAPIGTLSGPSTVSFGNVTVGSSSTQTVTLSNSGNASVQISAINVSGSGFSTTTAVPFTIAAGNSGTFSFVFSPQATGAATGSGSVVSNASNSPFALSLSGTGITTTARSVDLTWIASISVVSGYNIYRGSQTGGPYQRMNAILQSSTGYTDSGVASGQTFYYVVTAVDGSGTESAFSNEAVAVIP